MCVRLILLLTEHLHARYCVNALHTVTQLILKTSLWVGIVIISIFIDVETKRQKDKETCLKGHS